jgi:hypothetical protein
MASSMVYILAILGISPISAALLGSREVRKANSETFVRLAIRNNYTLLPRADRETYLQTTSAIFQNFSTSPWITDEYLVLPFWLSDLPQGESSWNYRSLRTNTWEANTTVFRNDFVCTDLHLSEKDMTQNNGTQHDSVLFDSDDGCHYNLTVVMTKNWMSWGGAHGIMSDSVDDRSAVVRLNDQCSGDETILLSTRSWTPGIKQQTELPENLTMRAYACHNDYTMATIPVRVTGTSEKQSVQFEEDLFRRMRTPIGSGTIDVRDLHSIYTDFRWDEFIPQEKDTPTSQSRRMRGPAAMLGRRYNFSVPAMIADPDLLAHAIPRGRFFPLSFRISSTITSLVKTAATSTNPLVFMSTWPHRWARKHIDIAHRKVTLLPKYEDVHRNTSKTITATLSTRVEMLHINPVAFWIATSILIWLIIVIIIFASVQRKYYGGMMRNVECVADVLVLIAGSERLLAVIKEKGIDTILKENKILTRLGWFRDPDGMMRWRIELVEDEQQMQLIPLSTSNAPVVEDADTEEGGAPLPAGEAQV